MDRDLKVQRVEKACILIISAIVVLEPLAGCTLPTLVTGLCMDSAFVEAGAATPTSLHSA
jgi:hypothetical protein